MAIAGAHRIAGNDNLDENCRAHGIPGYEIDHLAGGEGGVDVLLPAFW